MKQFRSSLLAGNAPCQLLFLFNCCRTTHPTSALAGVGCYCPTATSLGRHGRMRMSIPFFALNSPINAPASPLVFGSGPVYPRFFRNASCLAVAGSYCHAVFSKNSLVTSVQRPRYGINSVTHHSSPQTLIESRPICLRAYISKPPSCSATATMPVRFLSWSMATRTRSSRSSS